MPYLAPRVLGTSTLTFKEPYGPKGKLTATAYAYNGLAKAEVSRDGEYQFEFMSTMLPGNKATAVVELQERPPTIYEKIKQMLAKTLGFKNGSTTARATATAYGTEYFPKGTHPKGYEEFYAALAYVEIVPPYGQKAPSLWHEVVTKTWEYTMPAYWK